MPIFDYRLQKPETRNWKFETGWRIVLHEFRVSNFEFLIQINRQSSFINRQFSKRSAHLRYTRCPLPNYCFRLSNNFGLLQKRFAPRMGRDLVLLSISFDPVHDQPEVLAKYGAIWKADPKAWQVLTGPLSDVQNICQMLGMNFWPDEGLMTHSLRTVIIDREGKLAANLEGNEFTADQLGDLVQVTLDGSA